LAGRPVGVEAGDMSGTLAKSPVSRSPRGLQRAGTCGVLAMDGRSSARVTRVVLSHARVLLTRHCSRAAESVCAVRQFVT
jgi:hypothetical protein